MEAINLSYVVTTKNKLPYLTVALEKLIAHKLDDEEILVADAASTDGTVEYVQGLANDNKISFFVSQPDLGEAHALNKLFLAARGTLITIITDDDAFSFEGMRACKKFMLSHPEIDILGTNGGKRNQFLGDWMRTLDYTDEYKKWHRDGTPFDFCCLGLMIQRASIPLIGLWNHSFRRADAEYSFKLTAGKANLAWYTNPTFVNISNPQSVSLVYMEKIQEETDRLREFYLGEKPASWLSRKIVALKNKMRLKTKGKKNLARAETIEDWRVLFNESLEWLKERNQSPGNFLSRQL